MAKVCLVVLVSLLLVHSLTATEQPSIQTWHLVGYPVVVDTETDSPKSGTILVAWPGEDVKGQVKVPRIIVLIELENGRFTWRDILQVKVDTKKRAEQIKQMQKAPLPVPQQELNYTQQ